VVFIPMISIFRGKIAFTGEGPPKNRVTENRFIIIILAYSAIKNRANGPPAYSTLYPETSSDSPSVKSNGARFVSARVETNHMKKRGKQDRANQENS